MRYILNQIKTPDGTILTSYHVHDCKTYIDKNGEEYMVDGGTYYLRRNINKSPFIEQSLDSDEPFEVVRKNLHWGTYGKSGKKALKFVTLSEMSKSHIQKILELPESKLDNMYREYFWKELAYRKNKEE